MTEKPRRSVRDRLETAWENVVEVLAGLIRVFD